MCCMHIARINWIDDVVGSEFTVEVIKDLVCICFRVSLAIIPRVALAFHCKSERCRTVELASVQSMQQLKNLTNYFRHLRSFLKNSELRIHTLSAHSLN